MSRITPRYREYQFGMHIYNNTYTQEGINFERVLGAAYWATSAEIGIYSIPRKEGVGRKAYETTASWGNSDDKPLFHVEIQTGYDSMMDLGHSPFP